MLATCFLFIFGICCLPTLLPMSFRPCKLTSLASLNHMMLLFSLIPLLFNPNRILSRFKCLLIRQPYFQNPALQLHSSTTTLLFRTRIITRHCPHHLPHLLLLVPHNDPQLGLLWRLLPNTTCPFFATGSPARTVASFHNCAVGFLNTGINFSSPLLQQPLWIWPGTSAVTLLPWIRQFQSAVGSAQTSVKNFSAPMIPPASMPPPPSSFGACTRLTVQHYAPFSSIMAPSPAFAPRRAAPRSLNSAPRQLRKPCNSLCPPPTSTSAWKHTKIVVAPPHTVRTLMPALPSAPAPELRLRTPWTPRRVLPGALRPAHLHLRPRAHTLPTLPPPPTPARLHQELVVVVSLHLYLPPLPPAPPSRPNQLF